MARNSNTPAARGKSVNRSELARIFGVAPTTVDAWLSKGCPWLESPRKGAKNWAFDTAAVVEWRERQAAQGAATDTSTLDIDEARRRKTAAEAALAEYELAEKRADVVRVEDVARIIGEHNTRVRARLLATPARLAPLLAVADTAEECRDLVEGAVHEALAELAAGSDADDDDRERARGYGSDAGGDPEDEQPDAEASAEAESERVGGPLEGAQPGVERRAGPLDDLAG